MISNNKNTESKLFQSALYIFLRYGFHATTLQQIASHAGVQKSSVHYYFRSKDKLYFKIVEHVINQITDQQHQLSKNQSNEISWFLMLEFNNNETYIEMIINKIFLQNSNKIIEEIKKNINSKEFKEFKLNI